MKFQKRNVILTKAHSYVIYSIHKPFLILIPIERGIMSKNTTVRNISLFESLIDQSFHSGFSLNKVYPLRVTKPIIKEALDSRKGKMLHSYIPLIKNRYKDFYKTCCQHDYLKNLIVKFICNTEHLYTKVLTYRCIVKDGIPTLDLALEIL